MRGRIVRVVKCQCCSRTSTVIINTLIESFKSSYFAKKISDDTLFVFECEFCKSENRLPYSVVYHDRYSRFVVTYTGSFKSDSDIVERILRRLSRGSFSTARRYLQYPYKAKDWKDFQDTVAANIATKRDKEEYSELEEIARTKPAAFLVRLNEDRKYKKHSWFMWLSSLLLNKYQTKNRLIENSKQLILTDLDSAKNFGDLAQVLKSINPGEVFRNVFSEESEGKDAGSQLIDIFSPGISSIDKDIESKKDETFNSDLYSIDYDLELGVSTYMKCFFSEKPEENTGSFAMAQILKLFEKYGRKSLLQQFSEIAQDLAFYLTVMNTHLVEKHLGIPHDGRLINAHNLTFLYDILLKTLSNLRDGELRKIDKEDLVTMFESANLIIRERDYSRHLIQEMIDDRNKIDIAHLMAVTGLTYEFIKPNKILTHREVFCSLYTEILKLDEANEFGCIINEKLGITIVEAIRRLKEIKLEDPSRTVLDSLLCFGSLSVEEAAIRYDVQKGKKLFPVKQDLMSSHPFVRDTTDSYLISYPMCCFNASEKIYSILSSDEKCGKDFRQLWTSKIAKCHIANALTSIFKTGIEDDAVKIETAMAEGKLTLTYIIESRLVFVFFIISHLFSSKKRFSTDKKEFRKAFHGQFVIDENTNKEYLKFLNDLVKKTAKEIGKKSDMKIYCFALILDSLFNLLPYKLYTGKQFASAIKGSFKNEHKCMVHEKLSMLTFGELSAFRDMVAFRSGHENKIGYRIIESFVKWEGNFSGFMRRNSYYKY